MKSRTERALSVCDSFGGGGVACRNYSGGSVKSSLIGRHLSDFVERRKSDSRSKKSSALSLAGLNRRTEKLSRLKAEEHFNDDTRGIREIELE